MTQVCPHCSATVGEDSPQCPSCGQEMDVFQTIPPPRFAPPHAPTRPGKADPTPTPRPPLESSHASGEEMPRHDEPKAPSPAPKRRPKPAHSAAPPRPAPPPPPPQAPSPVMPPAQGYYYPPVAPPPPAADAQNAAPGKLRRWLIEQLGGRPSAAEAPPAASAPPPPPGYPYGVAHPPPGYPWGQPPSGEAPPVTPQPPHAAYAPTPSTPPSGYEVPAQPGADPEDEESRTIAFGADLAKFKIASSLLTLQIFDRSGQWRDWTVVGAGGLKVGRTEKNARFAEMNSMAGKHMRISLDGDRIVVEDLGSINGIYLKLNRFVELEDGQKFRVGAQVIEFQKGEPLPPAEPLISADGEAFWSRDSDAFGYLQYVRTDGKPGLRFPITKPDVTILGRESRPGRPVDIALPNVEWVSGQHAQVRRDGERFLLEDLGSRNGTFVQLRGVSEILAGDVLLLGRLLLRAVDPLRTPR